MKTSQFMLYTTYAHIATTCPVVYLNGTQISRAKAAKYLGMHLGNLTGKYIYAVNANVK